MTDAAPAPFPISEQDYQLWRHHPVSKVVLQYLSDYREALRQVAMERWESGALQLIDEKELRGRVLAVGDMIDLSHESMRSFYEGEKPESDSADHQ
jgi:hypothetical protein